MNYYKATEKYLYNYNSLKASIENMQKEITEMEYAGMSAMDPAHIPAKTYKYYSPSEDEAIRIAEKKTALQKRIKSTRGKLERIDRAIEALSEVERRIITERYIQCRPWWEVAYSAKYNERWCREIRWKAVRKVAIGLFGEKALQ